MRGRPLGGPGCCPPTTASVGQIASIGNGKSTEANFGGRDNLCLGKLRDRYRERRESFTF
jgi:hypothetical protein